MTFHIYQDESGLWRWHLTSNNGNIMADSGEGYTQKHNATEAIESICVAIRMGDITTTSSPA